jgi:predicted RNase H-like HicB family nuclease
MACNRGGEEMTPGAKYAKIVEWSDEGQCFIGSCPELFYGGCHGSDEREVFDHLCQIVEETIDLYRQDEKPLPEPLASRELVNALQRVA